jgi:hypothetical protein
VVVTATGPGGTDTANLTLIGGEAVPAIAFNPSLVSDTVGRFADHPAISTGGLISDCVVSSGILPAGLSLDPFSCGISGIPAAASPAVEVTVTAKNSTAEGSAVITFLVHAEPPPVIAYARPVVLAARNVVMAPDTIISTGGTVDSFTICPALPAGLTFNATNGTVGGSPSSVAAATDYVVIGRGPGGSDTAEVNFRVVAPPVNLSYVDDPTTYVVGVAITPNTPSVYGYVTRYSVSPPLPAGLALDTTIGVITGAAVKQSFASDYTVTAGSFAGSTSYALNITVVGPPSNLSYVDEVPTYKAGGPIDPPNMPTVRGIVTSYNVEPPLPDGVVLDRTTGYILGTPAAASTSRPYTITAGNPGGTASTVISIEVAP